MFKLKASHYLVFDLENNDLNKNFNLKKTFKNICWYNLINQPIIENKLLNEKKLISDLEKKLYKSVEQTMISDVPLGCFLSGGIRLFVNICNFSKYFRKKNRNIFNWFQ